MQYRRNPRSFYLVFCLLISANALPVAIAAPQGPRVELENRLKSQYAVIEQVIAAPPHRIDHPSDYRDVLRQWQNTLAQSFDNAAMTVEEILKLNPTDSEMWRERLETLRVYGSPISPPGSRTVFGDGEVKKKAKVISAPAAKYTDEARAENIRGEVRLRLILAADGTVKNVFPIKSLSHGLTESAMTAARQIRFEPAVRNDQPASQFATFVYEFRKSDATPYIPRTVF